MISPSLMILTFVKTCADIYSFSFIPKPFTLVNYEKMFQSTDFPLWFGNSLGIGIVTTLSVLLVDSLTGYVLCKMQFPGKNFIFVLILSTMMIPTEMLIIPWYNMCSALGWMNSYWSIMSPADHGSAFLHVAQFFGGVPTDLLEAARIERVSELGCFRVHPAGAAGLSGLASSPSLATGNAYLWPVIYHHPVSVLHPARRPCHLLLRRRVGLGADHDRLVHGHHSGISRLPGDAELDHRGHQPDGYEILRSQTPCPSLIFTCTSA